MSLRFNRKTSGDNQALGRSRGGFGSKIVGVCDAAGRLIDFVLVPGQAHELAPSLLLLKRLPKAPAWTLADMACDAKTFRSAVKEMGETGQRFHQACLVEWPDEGRSRWCRHARTPSIRNLARPISIAIAT
jgi:hypothetical protein